MIVSREELAAHLHIEHDLENAYLERLLNTAEATAKDFCTQDSFGDPPPEPVRWAILLYASHFYTNRENSDREAYETMMTAFRALLYPYKEIQF